MAPYDILVKIKSIEDFSGGHAGDTGLVPNPGRLRALRGNKAHAPQLLTLHPVLGTTRSLHGEGTVHLGLEVSLTTAGESLHAAWKATIKKDILKRCIGSHAVTYWLGFQAFTALAQI